MRRMVCLNPEEAFHIHTWRCGHAGDEREDAYIRTAMYLGAKQITFTDHAPFPGDSFRGRMKMADLPEYIKTLSELKAKTKERSRCGSDWKRNICLDFWHIMRS